MTLPGFQLLHFRCTLKWRFCLSGLFWPVCGPVTDKVHVFPQREGEVQMTQCNGAAPAFSSLRDRKRGRHRSQHISALRLSSPASSKSSRLLRDGALQQPPEDAPLMSGGCRRKSLHICASIYVRDPNSLLLLSSRVSIAICLDRLPGCQLIPVPGPELCGSRGEAAGAVGLPVTVSSLTVILHCLR